MGECCIRGIKDSNKDFLNPEEKVLGEIERKYPFHTISLSRLDKTLENHQYDHKLNHTHIRLILADLKLNQKYLTDPDCVQFKYFKALIDKDKMYTQQKLVLSAALLANESLEEKVLIIGKYYDFSMNKALEKDEICFLLGEIVDVSAVFIPLMAVADDEESAKSNLMSRANYSKYVEYLLRSKETFIEKYTTRILGTEVSIQLHDLAKVLTKAELSMLFHSSSVRQLLFNLSRKNQQYI